MKYLISLIYAALTFFFCFVLLVCFILSSNIIFPSREVWMSLQAVPTLIALLVTCYTMWPNNVSFMQVIMSIRIFLVSFLRPFLFYFILFFASSLHVRSQKGKKRDWVQLTKGWRAPSSCGKARLLTQALTCKGCICSPCPPPLHPIPCTSLLHPDTLCLKIALDLQVRFLFGLKQIMHYSFTDLTKSSIPI